MGVECVPGSVAGFQYFGDWHTARYVEARHLLLGFGFGAPIQRLEGYLGSAVHSCMDVGLANKHGHFRYRKGHTAKYVIAKSTGGEKKARCTTHLRRTGAADDRWAASFLIHWGHCQQASPSGCYRHRNGLDRKDGTAAGDQDWEPLALRKTVEVRRWKRINSAGSAGRWRNQHCSWTAHNPCREIGQRADCLAPERATRGSPAEATRV